MSPSGFSNFTKASWKQIYHNLYNLSMLQSLEKLICFGFIQGNLRMEKVIDNRNQKGLTKKLRWGIFAQY
jgi:hypothetical protein